MMKHSYLLIGTTLGNFFKLLARNGFSPYPKYLFRILFLTQNGIWALLFKNQENKKFRKVLQKHPIPKDPIIIIGHWRTGSTFLHQLMNLDENLVTPTVFQVTFPDSFLVSRKYYEPIMSFMIGAHRTMDNVKLGFHEPQEDEYALFKLTLDSPLERLIFPKTTNYFLLDYEDFEPSKENEEKWENAFYNFCKKINYTSGRRILLKNPFHSMRIPLLRKMFPMVRFIHIHRHPYKVVPSTIHMWNIVGRQNRLKKKWKNPTIKDVVTVMDRMYNRIQADLKDLPEKTYDEIRFEDFEKDPLSILRQTYNKLELSYSQKFENSAKRLLSELKYYKKNTYQITSSDKEFIKNSLQKHFIYYNYND